MAIRPCMAATEASIRMPVQSPAAYTPRADVRETRSTVMKPASSVATPASSRPRSAVLGTEPRARMQCEPGDGAAVGERDGDRVAVAGDRLHPGLAEHLHAAPGGDLLEDRRGVGVLAGQHPVAAS